nr:MAG TPA: hypothetical protein [Caudoviricetes sp.]
MDQQSIESLVSIGWRYSRDMGWRHYQSRDRIITAVLLIVAPQCIESGGRMPHKLGGMISRAVPMNRNYLSYQIGSLAFRFKVYEEERTCIQALRDEMLRSSCLF